VFPGAYFRDHHLEKPPAGGELVRLVTRTGTEAVAFFAPAETAYGASHPDAAGRPTIAFFYGNGMVLADTADIIDGFRREGLNVIAPDYPGFGMSPGAPSEEECFATADAVFDHLASRSDVDRSRIVAAGWSLGGAVALHLAAARGVAAVATFSTFTAMADMASEQYPMFPRGVLRALLDHPFANERTVAKLDCPLFVGHGRRDSLVPFWMADRLASAARGRVVRYANEADHGDFLYLDRSIYREVASFAANAGTRTGTGATGTARKAESGTMR
jgi:uncharacterized protein